MSCFSKIVARCVSTSFWQMTRVTLELIIVVASFVRSLFVWWGLGEKLNRLDWLRRSSLVSSSLPIKLSGRMLQENIITLWTFGVEVGVEVGVEGGERGGGVVTLKSQML